MISESDSFESHSELMTTLFRIKLKRNILLKFKYQNLEIFWKLADQKKRNEATKLTISWP